MCPDGHHCLNGSKCAENPYDEGSFYCDCGESIFEARYEGLKCEHRAEVYCVAEGATRHSFCTNGGKCVEYVRPEQTHVACECPHEFEGSHCQFVKGTKPKNWPYISTLQDNSTEQKQYSNAGAIVGTIVVVIAAGVVIVAFLYHKFYSFREDYDDVRMVGGLELGSNGSQMKDAVFEQSSMISMRRNRGTRSKTKSTRNKMFTPNEDERKSIKGNIV